MSPKPPSQPPSPGPSPPPAPEPDPHRPAPAAPSRTSAAPAAAAPPLPPDAEAVLRGIRDRRFAGGVRCPRCGSERCVRWGGFSGRQRYRCRGCRRTFSDLTATALAYTKRLPCWRTYLLGFRDGQSLRAAARTVGVHVSTTFRWRHKILRVVVADDDAALRGMVELHDVVYPISRKGTRQRPGEGRRRGTRLTSAWSDTPRHHVVFARDRTGLGAAFCLALDRTTTNELELAFRARVRAPATLLLVLRDWSAYRTAAHRCGLHLRPISLNHVSGRFAPDRSHHVHNIVAYTRRLERWIRRFRGVATVYLARYLAWHRVVDFDCDDAWLHACFGHVTPAPPRVREKA